MILDNETKEFFEEIYPLFIEYLKQNNIPLTALLREFKLDNVKKCSEFSKHVECVKGQWQSKNYIKCVIDSNKMFKDKLYFEEKAFIWYVLKVYFTAKLKFWS